MLYVQKFLRKNIINIMFACLILPLLVAMTFMNTEYLYMIDISHWTIIVYGLYFFCTLLGLFILRRKKQIFNASFHLELTYTLRSILMYTLFFLPAIWIVHFFMADNILEPNLYLRAYGKVAFIFVTLSLSVSPILRFVKRNRVREYVVLSRKIFGVLGFVFFLKHGLEYFAAEYVFQTQYHFEMGYFTYMTENILIRNDALSGVIAGIFMLVLGISSNKFSLHLLSGKRWKTLQSLVYPLFLLSLIHIAFSSRFDMFYGILTIWLVSIRTFSYLTQKENTEQMGPTTKYLCVPCGYIYDETRGDPDGGIAPGTKFEDIPDDWVCPVCGVGKSDFIPYHESGDTLFGGYMGRIVSYQALTKDVLELKLEVTENIKVLIGQYMILVLQDFDGEFTRSYSVAKYEDNTITFLIKLKDIGRAGRALKTYKEGDKIKIRGVYGKFILQDTQNPKVFIASGTGLAPIYNMMQHTDKGKKLLFSVHTQQDIFYLDNIRSTKVNTDIFLTREKDVPKNEDYISYFSQRVDLEKYDFERETEFYICGAPAMVEDVTKYLGERGFSHIFFEKFTI